MRENDLFDAWDNLSHAIDRMLTALPIQQTAAAELLQANQRTMRTVLQNYMLKEPKP